MHSTDNEILEVVDDEDRVIGTATRAEIHRLGLLHRAVHIFVFNESDEIYVQRRSASKDRHPLRLDSSAAGHVDPGESYDTTAARELAEELGIQAPVSKVLWVKASPATDNEHVALFTAFSNADPLPNPEEVLSGSFMTRGTLTRLMEEKREDFVPAFVLLWHEFLRRSA
jgi:isopentenyl-diphosphate Delta-isomerase